MFADFIPDILKKYFPILLFVLALISLNIAVLLNLYGVPSVGMVMVALMFGVTIVGCEMAFKSVQSIPYGYTENLAYRNRIVEEKESFVWNLVYISVFALISFVFTIFYEVSAVLTNAVVILEVFLYPYINFMQKYAMQTHLDISTELHLNRKETPTT